MEDYYNKNYLCRKMNSGKENVIEQLPAGYLRISVEEVAKLKSFQVKYCKLNPLSCEKSE